MNSSRFPHGEPSAAAFAQAFSAFGRPNRLASFVALLILPLLIVPTAAVAADLAPAQAQTVVDNFCIQCHGPEKAEGNLRLDWFATKHWDDHALLDKIVAKVADAEMPPEDAEKPLPSLHRTALLTHLKTRLTALDEATLAGKYKKLTAQEYNNTLIDLFGQGLEKLHALPFDSDKDLNKLGEYQVVTSYAAKKYYDVAADYLEQRILVESPSVQEFRYSPADTPKQWIHTSRFNNTPIGPVAGSGNMPKFMLRNPIASYAEEGEYEFIFDWHAIWVPGGKHRFNINNDYRAATPPGIPLMTVSGDFDVLNPVQQRAKDGNTFRVRYDQPIRIRLDQNQKFVSFGIENSFQKKSLYDHRFEFVGKYKELFKDEKPEPQRQETKEERAARREREKNADKMHVLITGVTIRGPINKQTPAFHHRVLGDLKRDDPFDDCALILRQQAERLFRRPVSDEVFQRYLTMARQEFDATNNTYAAIKAALTGMLCSPHFIFKYEGNHRDLDDYMIAARLSYFLHNSTPDEELLALAAAGKLQDSNVRRQQALRMLAQRKKADRFTRNFTHQWLGLAKFDQFAPNPAYIESSRYAQLQPDIAAEPQQFFNEILYNNLSALNFIDSDFVVWNRNLHSLYATPGMKIDYDRTVDKAAWQKMTLQENPHHTRGGLPSMGAILSLTTDGENPQPILRGVWLARRMLGTQIEAPSTVPAIEINLENVSRPREILAKHKEDRSCYVCHVKFDYLGLAMENYDVLGRFKEKYVHPIVNQQGKPQLITAGEIDSLSQTPGGQPMPGVAGVKAHLMQQKNTVMRHLVETLAGYALGREMRYKDRETIDALLNTMARNDYKLQDLILELVASPAFAQR